MKATSTATAAPSLEASSAALSRPEGPATLLVSRRALCS